MDYDKLQSFVINPFDITRLALAVDDSLLFASGLDASTPLAIPTSRYRLGDDKGEERRTERKC